MRELVEGVTKVIHIGEQLNKSIAGAGILTYVKALGGGHHLWEDVEGKEYLWGIHESSEGYCWEFVEPPVENVDITTFKVGDEVGLVMGVYSESKWNPLGTKGVVFTAHKGYGVYSVKWDNSEINVYEGYSLYHWDSKNKLHCDTDIEITNTTPPTGLGSLDMTLTVIPSDAGSKDSNWTDKHYNHYLTVKLTPEDIAAGEVKVKVDPYVVNELWGINTADKTGAGFHCLKTLSRMANAKNSLEREWDALIGQSTRARELLNK